MAQPDAQWNSRPRPSAIPWLLAAARTQKPAELLADDEDAVSAAADSHAADRAEMAT